MGFIASETTNENVGKQQVTVHPKQEITSFNANKLFQGLFLPGVYNAEVEQPVFSVNKYIFIIKAGTTLLFEKSYLDPDLDTFPVLGKIVLQDDAEVTYSESSIRAYSSSSGSISIIATWDYILSDPSNIYCKFSIVDTSEVPDVISGNDLVIATYLNHALAKQSGNENLYKISYQHDTNRNFLNNLYEVNQNFPVTFNGLGTEITVGSGNCILGDTYVNNSATLVCDNSGVLPSGVWPSPVTPPDASTYKQIDVLRIKNQDASTENQVIHLEWESFLKLSAGFTTVKTFIDGFDFVFEDIGYNVLYSVRNRAGLLATDPIWPQDCLIVNPLVPQIGVPETVSRFKLPIY